MSPGIVQQVKASRSDNNVYISKYAGMQTHLSKLQQEVTRLLASSNKRDRWCGQVEKVLERLDQSTEKHDSRLAAIEKSVRQVSESAKLQSQTLVKDANRVFNDLRQQIAKNRAVTDWVRQEFNLQPVNKSEVKSKTIPDPFIPSKKFASGKNFILKSS